MADHQMKWEAIGYPLSAYRRLRTVFPRAERHQTVRPQRMLRIITVLSSIPEG